MTTFHNLPLELLQVVADYLQPTNLLAFSSVNAACHGASQPRLSKLRRRYEKLDSIDLLSEILNNLDLCNFVRAINITEDSSPSILQAYLHPGWRRFIEDAFTKLRDAGLLTRYTRVVPTTRRPGAYVLHKGVTTVAAHLLPFCTRLRRLELREADCEMFFETLDDVFACLREIQTMDGIAEQQARSPFANLTCVLDTLVTISLSGGLTPTHLIACLLFPALKEINVDGMNEPEELDDFHDLAYVYERLHKQRTCPLERLLLRQCNIDVELINRLLSMIRPDTLRTLQLTSWTSNDELAIDRYRPHALISSLHRYTRTSLEILVILTNPAFTIHQVGLPRAREFFRNDADGTQCDFSITALGWSPNLRNFAKLKELTLDAALVLNGFGIVSYAEACVWRSSLVDRQLHDDVWCESDPDLAPPLVRMLPPSLESLTLWCYKQQMPPLKLRLHELLEDATNGSSPAGLPSLRIVMVYVGDCSSSRGGELSAGQAYWSSSGGTTGLVNGMFARDSDVLVDGSGVLSEAMEEELDMRAVPEDDCVVGGGLT